MLSRTIETLKYILQEYRFYFCIIIFLLSLLVYNRYEILIVEKKRLEIDKELYQLEVKSERRQKAYDEKMKQQQAEIERMIREIKSHK
ncbi:hypothetical protein [Flavobacterium sp. M31R6]|jgi:hypothetical protein|uniref:hypothetical protein n=1 Tax=Flavobacterium sp. M31R6 TaxID=2739062 RepID=UPI0015695688|nr:hypothetical protein [Flavobacterium sp. M31R6]QKJ64228.1 hypothetical protein HQN62_14165 [Flavobacterium sp. M31R6]